MLLAIWLPLFSGNAVAASVAMSAMSGDRHMMVATQMDEQQAHPALHHDQMSGDQISGGHMSGCQEQAAGEQDQANTSCHDCGVCHFACGGYLATLAVKVNETWLLTRIYTNSSTQFQSFTSAPLDPPPLARV